MRQLAVVAAARPVASPGRLRGRGRRICHAACWHGVPCMHRDPVLHTPPVGRVGGEVEGPVHLERQQRALVAHQHVDGRVVGALRLVLQLHMVDLWVHAGASGAQHAACLRIARCMLAHSTLHACRQHAAACMAVVCTSADQVWPCMHPAPRRMHEWQTLTAGANVWYTSRCSCDTIGATFCSRHRRCAGASSRGGRVKAPPANAAQ